MGVLIWAGIALLQVIALPGYLVTRALRLDEQSVLQTALLCFGLSLVLNHLLVVGLVLGQLYTRPVVLGIVLAECIAAIWLWRRRPPRATPLAPAIVAHLRDEESRTGRMWLLLCVVGVLGFLGAYVPSSFSRVLEQGDAIVSWNRWALDWETGHLPAMVYHYPQLVPTNWSLLYVIQDHPLQFLSRGIMSLFPLGIVLCFLDLAFRRNAAEFLVAAIVVAVLMVVAVGEYIGSGLVDIPVAFFALLAVYPLLLGDFAADPRGDARRLAASVLIAVGCAHTKQSGLYLVAVLPALTAFALRGVPLRVRWRPVAAMVGALAVGVGPWYAWVESRVARGAEIDELPILSEQIFGGMPLLERVELVREGWEHSLTPVGLYVSISLILLSLLHAEARRITLLISVPFTAIWALYFSYDTRNLSLALPFLAISIAGGASVLLDAAGRAFGKQRGLALGGLAALGLLVMVVTAESREILAASRWQLVQTGDTVLNKELLRYQQQHGFEGKILTNYRNLISFPTLRDHYFVNRGAPADEFWALRGDVESFARVVEDPSHDIRFILTKPPIDPAIARYLDKRVRNGRHEVVFKYPHGQLLRIRPRRNDH